MPSKIRKVPRPEAGGEYELPVYVIHHNCENAANFRSAMKDPDVDALEFNLISWGGQMPIGQPWAAQSTEPCRVCGVLGATWFEWAGPRFWIP